MRFDLTKKYEGCKLSAYLCDAGVPTIGWGTTVYPDGKKVKLGDKCTQKQADEYFKSYMDKHVVPYVKPFGLPPYAEEAFVSLVFNTGVSQIKNSALPALLKTKEYGKIMQNWVFTKAAGKSILGLARRRAEELTVFFKDFR